MEEEKKSSNLFKKKEVWISIIIGVLLGALLVYLLQIFGVMSLGSATIATTKSGKINENKLYTEMRKYYPVTYMLELVDKDILNKKYKLTDEQKNEVNSQIGLVLDQYKSYGYTEEQFFKENGFKDEEDFRDYLDLDYKRNLYIIDYFKTIIPEEEIKDYYNNNDVYGEINTKHILVRTSDTVKEEQALATAKEIISKLESGKSFDELVTEYADKIVSENVDFNSFKSSSLESSYVEASKALEKDKYTIEPVKTSYGYHIIYCINKAEKPSFEDVENDIVEKLGADLQANDPTVIYKALIKLREDNNFKIKDSKFKDEYKEYCDQVNGTVE